MGTITPQLSSMNGLNYVLAAPSVADVVPNDGKTFLLFVNTNASARTLTLTGNAFSKPGFGDISAADAGEVITIPGSGTNGGLCMVGPFPPDRFNNNAGQLSYTIDAVVGLTSAAIKMNPYI